jgi:DNA-binding MurR/RpiR family transcriptional regulator
LESAKQLLSQSRQFYVVGLRSMFPAAFYLHYACQMVNTKSVLLTGTGGTFADSLRYAARDDVVLAFSCRPYASDAVRAVEFMKRLGGKAIAITDSKVSPIAKLSDVVVVASNASTSLLPTVIPFMAIAEALAAMFVEATGETANEQIGRSEEQLLQFRAYQEDLPRRRPGSR